MLRIGFHVSISGSVDKAVDRAVELGCNTFQMFTSNPRAWKSKSLDEKEIKTFIQKVGNHDMNPIYGHMPYLTNLASPRDEIYCKSVNSLVSELERCQSLHIPYLVTHLGSHLGAGMHLGFERIIRAIDQAFDETEADVTLLLENTSDSRNSMGGTFESIQHIMRHLMYSENTGLCLDLCHAFAAGYDLRTRDAIERTLNKLNKTIGFSRLKLVHLNDSVGDLNSHLDRHEHIGMGKIGETGFANVLRSELRRLPMILETPKDLRRDDTENLLKVRDLIDENRS